MERRLWKRLFCIILVSQLICAQVVVAKDNASVTNVYAATQKDFYRYLNEFTKGGYASLTIHFDKGAFAVDEYRKGNSTENTVLSEVSPFHNDIIGIYSEESSQYHLRYMYDDSQSKAQKVETKGHLIRKTKTFAQQKIYKKLFSYVITGSEHVEMTSYGNNGEN